MLKPSTAVSRGISAGLRLGLFFLLSFLLLGYPPLLSLALASAGGYSMGLIVSWWHTEDDPPSFEDPLPEDVKTLIDAERKQQSIVGRMRLESQRKSRRRRRRQTRSSSLLSWLFGRGDRS